MTIIHNRVSLLMLAVITASLFMGAAPVYSGPSVSVLCYHSFMEKKKKDPFCFSIDELTAQITQLKKEGFAFVSVGDIFAGRIKGTKNVLITIDDGNKSVYEAFQKVFRPNGIRPLLAIYPNIIINKKKYALTWEQLAELANSGCDIAAHGYFHLKINKKLLEKNPGYFKKEIVLSKKVLEEKLNRKITIFVYPFGLRDETTISALKDAGYRYAFTINQGKIDVPIAGGGDRYELPRYMVTRTSWKYCFNSVIKNARPKVAYKVAALQENASTITLNASEAGITAKAEARPAAAAQKGPVFVSASSTADRPVRALNARREKKNDMESDFISYADRSVDQYDVTAPKRLTYMSFNKTNDRAGGFQSGTGPADPGIFSVKRPEAASRGDGQVRRRQVSVTDASSRSVDRDMSRPPGDGTALEGKVDKDVKNYQGKIKKRYRMINGESYGVYAGLLGRVRMKIERIKDSIRKYVVKNF